MEYGNIKFYASKTGGEKDPNLKKKDALMAVASIPLEEVKKIYEAKDIIFRKNKTYRKIGRAHV